MLHCKQASGSSQYDLTATTTTTKTTEEEEEMAAADLVFDRKLELATASLRPHVRKHLVTKLSHENAVTIVDYLLAMNSEISLSHNHICDNIVTMKS